jgi:hypothetical protein
MVTWIPGSESVAEAGKVLWRAIGGIAALVAAATVAARAPAPSQAATWRVHYARGRFVGLDEIGNCGAASKCSLLEQKRILAMLDQLATADYFG